MSERRAAGDVAVRNSLIVSAIGCAWSLFWLVDLVESDAPIWDLLVPLGSVVAGVMGATFAVVGLRRGVETKGTAIIALILGLVLVLWGIALVPVSVITIVPA